VYRNVYFVGSVSYTGELCFILNDENETFIYNSITFFIGISVEYDPYFLGLQLDFFSPSLSMLTGCYL
jgi:hypothetical protein